ncbi:amidase [Streptomyces sp. NBC_00249]|uniref:amidase n=1 Tax=Streptomyces sp. NBC_00249 TaxID=2975690 RepID=UPI002257D8FE|nr:amidase [Streptomyces sp. NBC_00249]MCX5198696.1 amidase [Streptomyces sp. NBC_00249]
MNEGVDAAGFAFELGWKLRGLETALAPRGVWGPEGPKEPPPAGWQRFTLVHCPVEGYPGFDDPRYAGLRASPPRGCAVEDLGGCLGLRCERPGGRLLDAVAELCAEIRGAHGLLMTGLGVDRLWEWAEDGSDGWGAEIVGQLLLMAAERGPKLGYGAADLARFLRTAAGV